MATSPAGASRQTAQRPRPAATIVLLRDTPVGGPQVLMLRRHDRSGFAAGAWVFPGGVVEEDDRTLEPERWSGISPSALEQRFADDAKAVLGFHVAAVRETFEEAGILLATGQVDPATATATQQILGERGAPPHLFTDFLRSRDLVLRLDTLTYLSRWITPKVEGRRFDTVFFVAATPEGQRATHDDVETTAKRWVRAAEALAAHRDQRFPMIHPTVMTLEWLTAHTTAADAVAAAAAQPSVPWVLPHVDRQADGSLRFLHPGDDDFPHELYADELRGPAP